jgi:hypothetical protein
MKHLNEPLFDLGDFVRINSHTNAHGKVTAIKLSQNYPNWRYAVGGRFYDEVELNRAYKVPTEPAYKGEGSCTIF